MGDAQRGGLRAPRWSGANATLIVQEPAAGTVVQVLVVMVNWVGSVPTSVAPLTTRSATPVLLTVTSWLAVGSRW